MSQESNKTDKSQDHTASSDQIAAPKKAGSKNNPPISKGEQREARLAKALRANLRRRKSGPSDTLPKLPQLEKK